MPTTMDAVPHQTVRRGRGDGRSTSCAKASRWGSSARRSRCCCSLVVDVAAGVPLHTPAILGSALFYGTRSPGRGGRRQCRPCSGYTVVHLAGFALLGLAVSGLFALAEREKRVLALIFMLGCYLSVMFHRHGVRALAVDARCDDAMNLPGGHVLGFVSMVGALTYFHERLLRRMPEALDGE